MPLERKVGANSQVFGDGPVDLAAALGLLVPEYGISRKPAGLELSHKQLVKQIDSHHPRTDRMHAGPTADIICGQWRTN
jgi:hypothetical protein